MSVNPAYNVVAPNIFDALVHPEVVLPIIVSHLLSERFWERRDRVVQRLDEYEITDPSVPRALYAIWHAIDRSFEHVYPKHVGEIYGSINIEAEGKRLGDEAVQQACASIVRAELYRKSIIADHPLWLHDAITSGTFPNYTYTTFDVIRAHRVFSAHRRSSRLGLVSCTDEMALFCAAALTFPLGSFKHVVLLAGPSHYTVFLVDHEDRGYWYPSKRHLFSQQSWKAHVQGHYEGSYRNAIEGVILESSRIISVQGTFNFHKGTSSIPAEMLLSVTNAMREFFGVLPVDLAHALEKDIFYEPTLPHVDVLQTLVGSTSCQEALDVVRNAALQHDAQWAHDVLLAYRSVEVLDRSSYLDAARRGVIYKDLASGFACVDDICEYIKSIPGRESIFGTRDRVALPDETIRLQTGSDRDLALLLHVLLEEYYRRQCADIPVTSYYTNSESVVAADDLVFSTTTMSPIPAPPSAFTCRLGA
jgi:hypothetical protein